MITNNQNHQQQNDHINTNNSKLSNQSQSLQIVQPQTSQNRISLINNSNQGKSNIHNQYNFQQEDILNYSIQQDISININLIDQQSQQIKQSQNHYIIQQQQPNKRKRKDIFAKYKKTIIDNTVQQQVLGTSRKFQQTLDQLFNTKNSKIQQEKTFQIPHQQQPKKQKRRFQKFKKQTVLQVYNINHHNNQNLKINQFDSHPNLKNHNSDINSNKTQKSPSLKNVNSNDEDLYQAFQRQNKDLSDIPFRISQIPHNLSNFDDSKELENILQSPIFVQNQNILQKKQSIIVQQKFVTINNANIKIPKILIPQQIKNLSPSQSQRQNAFQYDKINITQQSVSNSVMIQGDNNNNGIAFKNFNHIGALNSNNDQLFKNIQQDNNKNNRSPRARIIFGSNDYPNNNQLNLNFKHRKIFQDISPESLSDRSRDNSYQKQNDIEQRVYEQSRIPIFLRKARKANTYYPNFYHQDAAKHYDQENIRLQKLVSQFHTALAFLQQISLQINQKAVKNKEFQKRFENGFKLDYFLNSGWQRHNNIQRIQELKPKGPFAKRPFDFQKIQTALKSYRQIIKYYKNVQLNLSDQRGRQKFIDIRKKFWAIEWNIRIVSEDLYSQTLKFDFPLFYHQCLDFLKKPFPKAMTRNAIQQRRYLIGKYQNMKHQKDILANSQIGQALKQKLDKQMKFLCPY